MGASVLFLSRRGRLSFRYTAGWLGFFLLSGFLGLFSPLTQPMARWLGVTPGVVLTFAAAVALLAICIQLSISISGLQEQIRRLSEDLAILEEHSQEDQTN